MDWFLYDNGLRHERVNSNPKHAFKHCKLASKRTGTTFFMIEVFHKSLETTGINN